MCQVSIIYNKIAIAISIFLLHGENIKYFLLLISGKKSK